MFIKRWGALGTITSKVVIGVCLPRINIINLLQRSRDAGRQKYLRAAAKLLAQSPATGFEHGLWRINVKFEDAHSREPCAPAK